MKLFFADSTVFSLSYPEAPILGLIRKTILDGGLAEEVTSPDKADAILIQENNEYKDYRYINDLLADRFVDNYIDKIFTISDDDSATGVFRGLYASIPQRRFDRRFHRSVPYIRYANDYVFKNQQEVVPKYLAGWYGNTKSNAIRKQLVAKWQSDPSFAVKHTHSWYNHKDEEQKAYVALILNSKFSLCPAGWAPPSPRIYESMALGRCPVIISDGFVRPQGPDWDDFALFYPESSVSKIDDFLKRQESQFQQLGKKAKENWERHFAGDLLNQYYASTLIELISSTPKVEKVQEIKRWQSISTYWINKWTVPQRVSTKIIRILKSKNSEL
ncbi:MAG: hypothetical protein EOO10_03875 [Chitinophagaceae bacterium]|nr:MAG: hypothetical protein EOO10_03875 [Chitinophagaceae bacterium]